VEDALRRLGVADVPSPAHLEQWPPDYTCVRCGVIAEAILRELWKTVGIRRSSAGLALEDLFTHVKREMDGAGKPMPRSIQDYIRALQANRNRAAHWTDDRSRITRFDALESLQKLSELAHWYFVEVPGASSSASVSAPNTLNSPPSIATPTIRSQIAHDDKPLAQPVTRPSSHNSTDIASPSDSPGLPVPHPVEADLPIDQSPAKHQSTSRWLKSDTVVGALLGALAVDIFSVAVRPDRYLWLAIASFASSAMFACIAWLAKFPVRTVLLAASVGAIFGNIAWAIWQDAAPSDVGYRILVFVIAATVSCAAGGSIYAVCRRGIANMRTRAFLSSLLGALTAFTAFTVILVAMQYTIFDIHFEPRNVILGELMAYPLIVLVLVCSQLVAGKGDSHK
jgi:hypothetical protein